MARDEPQDGDTNLQIEGLNFVIDKQLYDIAEPIRIDSELLDNKEVISLSSAISENFCSVAKDPSSCTAFCDTDFCELPLPNIQGFSPE